MIKFATMLALIKKELASFWGSIMGYVVIIVFLISTGMLLWVLKETGFNIVESGYATLEPMFYLAPWVFLFLIPAITMRTIADEYRGGTIELLFTKPLSSMQIVMSKFVACLLLLIVSLLPTLVYYLSIHYLAAPVGNVDHGAILGSYLGLIFMAAAFIAIGIFASSLTDNQIIAFLIAVFFSLIFLVVLDRQLFFDNNTINSILAYSGILYHYQNLSKGVLSLQDFIYFISLSGLFLLFTKFKLEGAIR
jgi:ABC-2 type transport system permease protein